jgi:hypothetical protein
LGASIDENAFSEGEMVVSAEDVTDPDVPAKDA